MKIKFLIQSEENFILPLDYKYHLCKQIYKYVDLKFNKLSEGWNNSNVHDSIDLISLSQIYNLKDCENGYKFYKSYFFVSSPNNQLIATIALKLANSSLFDGKIKILEPKPLNYPSFEKEVIFIADSIYIQSRNEKKERIYYCVENGEKDKSFQNKKNNKYWHIKHDNKKCSEIMERMIFRKADQFKIKIDSNLKISFDTSFKRAKIKNITIKNNIKGVVSVCPVIISCDENTMKFVYDCGVGSTTTMGLGSIQ